MNETLETIAGKIAALSEAIDARFDKVDQRFVETKAQLGVKIEALDDKISLVYDAVLAQQGHTAVTQAAHDALKNRVADHDVRLLALESRKPEDH